MDGHELQTRNVAAGLGVSAIGGILVGIHLVHIIRESGQITLVLGGIVPFLLAVGIVAVGIWLTFVDWEWRSVARLIVWLAMGMSWMSIAGAGAIFYELVEGATLTHTWFLVAMFATYGAIPGVITGLYDTQRQRRQERLKIQEQAMASAIDGMAIHDADGRFRYLNAAHAEIYGYDSPVELLGEHWTDLYEGDEAARLDGEIFPALESQGSWRGSATGKRKDGTTFEQRISLTALEDGGLICIVRDVSDEVDREVAFSVLNRVLRHNLSNEINVVVGQAERIRTRSSGELAQAAHRIEEVGMSLSTLADKERQIADLVLRDPDSAPMDLESILTHALGTIEQRYPDATVDATVPTDLTISAIPEFERALIELLENAVVHTDQDQPWAAVEVTQTEDATIVSVSDEGPGIPDQDRAVVEGKHEIDALFHGSGLGLWYVYWVMHNLGGSVRFTDREPRGTTVELVVPTG